MARHVSLAIIALSFLSACNSGVRPGSDAGTDASTGDGSMPPDAAHDSGGGDAGGGDAGGDAGGGDAGHDLGMMSDGGGDASTGDAGMCATMDLAMMTGVGIFTGSTAAITTILAPSCLASGTAGGPGIFFTWTAPATGMYSFDTLGSTDATSGALDTLLAVYDGTCTGTELGCNDDGPFDVTSRVDLAVTAGHVYVLSVSGYDGATGTVLLSITQPAADEVGHCHDSMDNDRDGYVDCQDSDCSPDPTCTETNCTNGLDDDMDGSIDCADTDCSGLPICVAPLCANGVIDTGEACDDGNHATGDGCDDYCQFEPFYRCTGTPSVCVLTHLVINEIDYDQAGTDSASFIEVYNPSSSDVYLDDYAIVLVNGTSSAEYRRFNLIDAGGPLGAGQYLVIGNASIVAAMPATVLTIMPTVGDFIQNGPDGVALVDVTASTLVDALSYEGSLTAVTITGLTGTVSLVEGTAFAGADTNDDLNSLARVPNGSDTDNAVTDWVLTMNKTPGAANLP